MIFREVITCLFLKKKHLIFEIDDIGEMFFAHLTRFQLIAGTRRSSMLYLDMDLLGELELEKRMATA